MAPEAPQEETEPSYPNALTDKKPTRKGYVFKGWHYEQDPNLQGGTCASDWDADGNGTYYYNDKKILYAVWLARKCTLTLDKNHSDTAGWTPGTTTVYQKYDSGWFSDTNCTQSLGSIATDGTTTGNPITPPTRTGYDFLGYYDTAGTQYFDANGYLVLDPASNVEYDGDTDFGITLNAKWKPQQHLIFTR